MLAVAGQKLPASFLNQGYGFADAATTTVTAASQQPLTTSYSIPANEPAVGSAYEVRFGGNGTWGSTQQQLTFTLVIQGVVVVNLINGIAAAAFNASAAFRFTGLANIVFSATGVSGGAWAGLSYTLSESASAVNPGAAGTNTIGVADANGTVATIDTTSSMAVIVKCGWAATTGAPTISNHHTIFRKIA